jgi:NAD(P)-dependent dehydrogenase (short-subunit alcohol dehydrogenase family)
VSERVLITGCSSGIGRATATALAAAGYEVFPTARDPEALRDLDGTDHESRLKLDVTDPVAVDQAVEYADPVDVLINCAGYGLAGMVEEVSDSELRAQYEVNVFGPWRLCRAALPGMRRRGHGTIVNVSSFGGEMPWPGIGAYRSSKYALEGLSATLRLEVASFGIKVLVIQPGRVNTAFAGRSLQAAQRDEPEYTDLKASAEAAYERMSPAPGIGPEDVAAAIVGALADEADSLHVAVGPDAERALATARSGRLAYERFLYDELSLDWRGDRIDSNQRE